MLKIKNNTKEGEKKLVKNKKENKKIKIPECNFDIYSNMVYAVIIMEYFIALNLLYLYCAENIFKIYIKISYMLFLLIAIFTIEVAYKKDNDNLALTGIEYIIVAIYILLIERIVTLYNLNMNAYIVMSSYIFPIYYTFKSIVIDTKERMHKLKKLSDIQEIIKEEKPVKKVAKKRKI